MRYTKDENGKRVMLDDMKTPNFGDYVETPRFLEVRIDAVVKRDDAKKLGFVEPTHLKGKPYKVLGRHIGTNLMNFAVVVD